MTDRQEAFVRHYIATGNRIEAVKLAGYEVKDDQGARVQSNRLLRTASVVILIDQHKAKLYEKARIDADGVALRFQMVF